MKQFFASILIAFLVASGLVAASGSTAQAAECGYQGCIQTTTNVSAPTRIRQGNRIAAVVRVRAVGSNVTPRGTIKLVVKSVEGGYFWSKTFKVNGTTNTLRGPSPRKLGKYFVQARFIPGARAPFRTSSDATIIRVVKRLG